MDPNSEFAVATARHIDSTPVGDVDVAIAENAPINNTCSVSGWASTGKNVGARWFYQIPSCGIMLSNFDEILVQMSDDGSTVAFAVFSTHNSSGGPDYPSATSQLHVLNGQTGQLLFIYDLHDYTTTKSMMLHVSMSRHGEYIAFGAYNLVYVLEKATGKLRGDPFDKTYQVPVQICPMGVFLVGGYQDGFVAKWDATSKSYVVQFTVPGQDSEGNVWMQQYAATSVNGGGSNPDGCLVAFAWMAFPYVDQVRVTVHNLLTGKTYWEWKSDNIVGQTIPMVSFHMGYLAVSHWGDEHGRSPTVFLFNLKSNVPVWNVTTPGSPFDVEVLVDSAKVPPLDDYKTYEEMPKLVLDSQAPTAGTDVVYVTAAGKAVHASIMGRGGDAYAWQLTL